MSPAFSSPISSLQFLLQHPPGLLQRAPSPTPSFILIFPSATYHKHDYLYLTLSMECEIILHAPTSLNSTSKYFQIYCQIC